MRITRQALAATAAVAVAAAGGSAFTAANTGTPLVSAGQSATVTTGFAVSAVKYELDSTATRGDYLINVDFTLTPSGSNGNALQAKVRLVAGGAYYGCTRPDAVNFPLVWDCVIASGTTGSGGIAVSTVDTLDIVAVSQPAS